MDRPPGRTRRMPSLPPLDLLLAAPPGAPGALALFERARRRLAEGGAVRVLLTGAGLAWARDARLAAAAEDGARVALCSRSARDGRLDPGAIPAFVAWSSLVAWLRDAPPGHFLWSAFP